MSGAGDHEPRATRADDVASKIVDLIHDTALREGDPIPSEGELAARFEVNRLAVREAVRMLVGREILESRQGRPARVTVPSAAVVGQILCFRLRQRTLDYRDLLDTRRLIEVELAARAAERVGGGSGDPTAASRLLTTAIRQTGDRDRFIELDIAFHDEVAALAGAETLRLLLGSLADALRNARRASYEGRARRGRNHATTIEHHAQILDAVVAGDSRRARAAMSAHLGETARDLATLGEGSAAGSGAH